MFGAGFDASAALEQYRQYTKAKEAAGRPIFEPRSPGDASSGAAATAEEDGHDRSRSPEPERHEELRHGQVEKRLQEKVSREVAAAVVDQRSADAALWRLSRWAESLCGPPRGAIAVAVQRRTAVAKALQVKLVPSRPFRSQARELGRRLTEAWVEAHTQKGFLQELGAAEVRQLDGLLMYLEMAVALVPNISARRLLCILDLPGDQAQLALLGGEGVKGRARAPSPASSDRPGSTRDFEDGSGAQTARSGTGTGWAEPEPDPRSPKSPRQARLKTEDDQGPAAGSGGAATSARTWSTTQSFKLCRKGEERAFRGRVKLLGKAAGKSVREAVQWLSTSAQFNEECCVVFTPTNNYYYVLYQRGSRQAALDALGIAEPCGVLSVQVLKAHHIREPGWKKRCDPYVVMSIGSERCSTHVVADSLAPAWNTDAFQWQVNTRETDRRQLLLEVIDQRSISGPGGTAAAHLGHVALEIADLPPRRPVRKLWDLLDGIGQLELEVQFSPKVDLAIGGNKARSRSKKATSGLGNESVSRSPRRHGARKPDWCFFEQELVYEQEVSKFISGLREAPPSALDAGQDYDSVGAAGTAEGGAAATRTAGLGATAASSMPAMPEPEAEAEGMLSSPAVTVEGGQVLRCVSKEAAAIFQDCYSSVEIGKVRRGDTVLADGGAVTVGGFVMVPIRPRGAVELPLFSVQPKADTGGSAASGAKAEERDECAGPQASSTDGLSTDRSGTGGETPAAKAPGGGQRTTGTRFSLDEESAGDGAGKPRRVSLGAIRRRASSRLSAEAFASLAMDSKGAEADKEEDASGLASNSDSGSGGGSLAILSSTGTKAHSSSSSGRRKRLQTKSLERNIALEVAILHARGLRKGIFRSRAEASCSCEVPGKGYTTVKTKTVKDDNPIWDEIHQMNGYSRGDPLEFTVWDGLSKMADCTLTSEQFLPDAFDGYLQLSLAGASLRLHVSKAGAGETSFSLSTPAASFERETSEMGPQPSDQSVEPPTRSRRLGFLSHIMGRSRSEGGGRKLRSAARINTPATPKAQDVAAGGSEAVGGAITLETSDSFFLSPTARVPAPVNSGSFNHDNSASFHNDSVY